MARPERPLDSNESPVARFAGQLRLLRRQVGGPPYRVMAQRVRYSPSALSNAAAGHQLPSLEVALAFVTACGADRRLWEARWRATAQECEAGPPIAATPDDAPPDRGGTAPFTLPPDVADYTGRHRELLQVVRQVIRRSRRPTRQGVFVLTVSGAPGVGKTAFAVRLGHLLRRRFPDGLLFADLGTRESGRVTSPEILQRLLRAFGSRGADVPDDLDALVAMYRSVLAGRRVLVVLDGAVDEEQVRPLLPPDNQSAALVTSRSLLTGLDGAQLSTLAPLPYDQALLLLSRVAGAARIDAERNAAREVVNACAGLPVALRIAAARLAARPNLSVAQLATRLSGEDNRLAELHTGDRTIRRTFASSYGCLSPPVQELFRRLGLLLSAEFTPEPVAALADVDVVWAESVLEQLVDLNMVQSIGDRLYRLNDLIRLYSRELVQTEESPVERDAASIRLLDWYLHTADAAGAAIAPSRLELLLDAPRSGGPALRFTGRDDGLRWCESQRDNLTAATDRAARLEQYSIAWQLPVALFDFFAARRHWLQSLPMYQTGLSAARRVGDRLGEARTLTCLGFIYHGLRQIDTGVNHLEQALPIYREVRCPDGERFALRVLNAARAQRRPDDMWGAFRQPWAPVRPRAGLVETLAKSV